MYREFTSYLIHFVPCGVQILLDDMTLECYAPYVDLDVGVTLALHHAPHQVVLSNQILGLQQVNPQQPLQDDDGKCYKTYRESLSTLFYGPVNK